MRECHEVFGHELPPLPQKSVLSVFYTPSNEQRIDIYHFKHDWNCRGFVVLRTLNYVIMI